MLFLVFVFGILEGVAGQLLLEPGVLFFFFVFFKQKTAYEIGQ